MDKKDFYIECHFRIKDITQEDGIELLEKLENLGKKYSSTMTTYIVKDNPTYDSQGNLWE